MNEHDSDTRKWYAKKRFIIPAVILGLAFLSGDESPDKKISNPTTSQAVVEQHVKEVVTQKVSETPASNTHATVTAQPTSKQVAAPAPQPTLSNDNHYTNTDGNSVHSPAYTSGNSVPSGATARCRDGTYSFSQNHRGTCSHHGGVATWY